MPSYRQTRIEFEKLPEWLQALWGINPALARKAETQFKKLQSLQRYQLIADTHPCGCCGSFIEEDPDPDGGWVKVSDINKALEG